MTRFQVIHSPFLVRAAKPALVSDSRIRKAPFWLIGSMRSSMALPLLMPVNSHLCRRPETIDGVVTATETTPAFVFKVWKVH